MVLGGYSTPFLNRRKTDSGASIISFVGIDGAGKTTHSRRLKSMLQNKGIKVSYIHVFSTGSLFPVRFSKQRLLDNALTKLDTLCNTRAGSITELIVRLPFILFESWFTLWWYRIHNHNRVVIFDRYFYDKLVTLFVSYCRNLNPIIVRSVIMTAKLMARPDVVVMLMVRPEVALSRKKVRSLQEAQRLYELYNLLSIVLSIRPIIGELPVDVVERAIVDEVNKSKNQFKLTSH